MGRTFVRAWDARQEVKRQYPKLSTPCYEFFITDKLDTPAALLATASFFLALYYRSPVKAVAAQGAQNTDHRGQSSSRIQ
ncbi:MAG: hypothetical protein WCP07_06605 [bacterium]